ncbi:hypothetical protein [Intrasporangium sp.]|uniref:hypothetical protein n=1 Tax=Intrasporangium sp. TaxID=1925024 RepID=UPI00293A72D2|nr:hypothetical protein [Intrasporangium sp.]MDV3223219.1 hypothetical protein [Intrasporangium sp.]
MTGAQMRGSSVLDVVARHEEAALGALEAATGGAPLCRTDGTPQTVKGSEGAVAALSDVRRALRLDGRGDGGSDPVAAAQSVIDDVRARWGSIRGPLAARPGTDEYVAGGLAALSTLEDDLSRSLLDPEGSDAPTPGATDVGPRAPEVGVLAAPPVPGVLGRASTTGGAGVRWPRRRRLAAAVIMVGLVALIAATVGWPFAEAPLWSALTGGAVVASSLALALFVPRPGEGWRPDFGCAPCAVAGLAMAVAAPWLAIETAPDAGRAALALVLGGAALARRLTEPPVCGGPAA